MRIMLGNYSYFSRAPDQFLRLSRVAFVSSSKLLDKWSFGDPRERTREEKGCPDFAFLCESGFALFRPLRVVFRLLNLMCFEKCQQTFWYCSLYLSWNVSCDQTKCPFQNVNKRIAVLSLVRRPKALCMGEEVSRLSCKENLKAGRWGLLWKEIGREQKAQSHIKISFVGFSDSHTSSGMG